MDFVECLTVEMSVVACCVDLQYALHLNRIQKNYAQQSQLFEDENKYTIFYH